MRTIRQVSGLVLVTLIAGSTAAQAVGIDVGERGNAGARVPVEEVLGLVEREALGLSAADLAGAIVTGKHRSANNGVTHYYLRQVHGGLEIINSSLGVHLLPDGSVLRIHNQFVSGLAGKVQTVQPTLSPEEAVLRSAEEVGLPVQASLRLVGSEAGADRATFFASRRLSLDEIPVRLRYLATPTGAVRLVWQVALRVPDGQHWWNVWVDAEDGRVLQRGDRVAGDAYRVFALPKESPLDGPQTVEIDPAHPVSSPFGWHDTDGVPGAEFTDTRGNNVDAHDDLDANNVAGARVEGGPELVFDEPFDAGLAPLDNLDSAIVNLFYWNNTVHDLLYLYGFDEAAGNFQENNYGNGGAGGDAVQADAQDGLDVNNATFATPADGLDPRMTMFIWLSPPTLTIGAPVNIAGDYDAGPAAFGADLDLTGVSGDFELVDDGTALPSEGCNPLVGFTAGKVALIDRGSCEFGVKVLNAEQAGAVAAVVVNNQGDGVMSMGAGAVGDQVTIASVFIGQGDGDLIKAELDVGVSGVMTRDASTDRDSDHDNGVMIHEYGHGVSNRLTDGPNSVFCLNTNVNPEQMGEGWSDWFALVMTAVETDTGPMSRGIGNYLVFEEGDGPGIRNFPYSTDLSVNPQTYADIAVTNIPHGVGEIWSAMLWEMYWDLVDEYGWGDVWTEPASGPGIALQLVMDGLKLQPCNPNFAEGRDAILDADVANNGGANQCLIWEAFAKRGMGFSADAGGPSNTDGSEAFDLPPLCDATGIDLSISGSCPGSMTVEIANLTPGASVGVGLSGTPGTFDLPSGDCAGTTLNLGLPLVASRFVTADANGTVQLEATPSDGVCNSKVQAVDLSTCEVSEVVDVP